MRIKAGIEKQSRLVRFDLSGTSIDGIQQKAHSISFQAPLAEIDHLFYSERRAMAHVTSGEISLIKQFHTRLEKVGHEIFQSVFSERPGMLPNSPGVIEIELDDEKLLWGMPWELMHDGENGFVDSSAPRPIVRFIDRPVSKNGVVAKTSPFLCFVGSNPALYPTQAQDQYEAIISQNPIEVPIENIRIDVVDGVPQWERAVTALKRSKPVALHIVAHGRGREGFLFENKDRDDTVIIGYQSLVNLLIELGTVRTLFLAICGSGEYFTEHPKSIFQLFEQTPLDAMLTMATDIGLTALTRFTKHFYKSLWKSDNIDTAVWQGREALRFTASDPISLQWSVPMLFERTTASPLGLWLNNLKDQLNNPPLPREHLETTEAALDELQKVLGAIKRIQGRAKPSRVDLVSAGDDLENALEGFLLANRMLDLHYDRNGEAILDNLRAAKSHVVPLITQLLEVIRSDSEFDVMSMATRASVGCRKLQNLTAEAIDRSR